MKYYQLMLLGLLSVNFVTLLGFDEITVQPGIVLRDAPVHLQPSSRSDVLYQIKEDSKVYIQERHKSWYKIDAKNRDKGWLRLLNVRYLGNPKQTTLGEISSFSADVFNVQRSGPVVTTGVRGINEEDFKNATPDYTVLNIILANKVKKKTVLAFAKQGNLIVKDIKNDKLSTSKKENTND